MKTLPETCGTCRYFDGDCHCTLPVQRGFRVPPIGFIPYPRLVVCAKHEPAEPDETEGAPV